MGDPLGVMAEKEVAVGDVVSNGVDVDNGVVVGLVVGLGVDGSAVRPRE